MRSTTDQLLREIQRGEDSYLELKEVRLAGGKVRGPQANRIADELAAYANTRGGVLVLGVDDRTREITGIPREALDTVVTHVRQAVSDLVDPPLDIVLERMAVPDSLGEMRLVVRVAVERSLHVHRSPSGYLKRLADEKRAMTTEALRRLMRARSQAEVAGFDEEIIPKAAFTDLDPERVRRFRTALTQDDDETLACKLGMARAAATGEARPTVAGVLLGARAVRRWLPNAFIQAVAYRGRFVGNVPPDRNYQLDAHDCVGPLDEQIAGACRFVARNQRIEAHKNSGRRDLPQFHMGSVFEAVVNAVAHRDYSIHGSKVRLRMFDDRLELYSPGALPNTLTLDALHLRQVSRNAAISSLLARCPVPEDIPWLETSRRTLMDRRGEGVGLILIEGERHSGKAPEYRMLDESELLLTIFAAGPAAPGYGGADPEAHHGAG